MEQRTSLAGPRLRQCARERCARGGAGATAPVYARRCGACGGALRSSFRSAWRSFIRSAFADLDRVPSSVLRAPAQGLSWNSTVPSGAVQR